jgi:hypothetical protein
LKKRKLPSAQVEFGGGYPNAARLILAEVLKEFG